MSFQAYIDAVEVKSGMIPSALLEVARERGFSETSKANDVAAWLKEDYGIGRGHAMAFFHVLKNGPEISEKHVGSGGTHEDESAVLRLDGKANR
ncbi:DUF4287 domain-containing protein [Kineosporia babensis]|uniref:DUF4287 domain-containing protein n=1 Tax=Kineosporia babensis TaxID=499548 RepID=A0A9X1NGB0_9ACTN|nr:DUF4287 domain-containing protein [Kineosporia babensis]MCD5313505.1 DUF4287 domain-containing protein [Kineosporia babensis]